MTARLASLATAALLAGCGAIDTPAGEQTVSRNLAWAARCGRVIDVASNNLFLDGRENQTVSVHAAMAERAGKRLGCWLCWLLAKIVQPPVTADAINRPAHYGDMVIKPWTFCVANNLSSLETAAVTYIARARRKGNELADHSASSRLRRNAT